MPAIQLFFTFAFPCLLEGLFGTGYVFPGDSKKYYHAASTQRGLLQLMAHQPIAIDCAGADGGRVEGAGSTEPGLSTDQGITSLSLACSASIG